MKNFLLLCSITLLSLVTKAQTLVGISPNVYVQGSNTTLTTTITGQGTGFFLSSSSPGMNIYNGSTIYYGDYFGTTVSSDTTFTTTLVVSPTAPLGSYTLVVDYFDGPAWSNPNTVTLTLPNAFTVVAPDGYAIGTVFNDMNQNGVQDVGENGIPNQSLLIQPGNISVTTNANGMYSAPLANGSYTLQLSPSGLFNNYLFTTLTTANLTINNSNDTLDVPTYLGITSSYPDSAFRGQVFNLLVHSTKGIFNASGVLLSGTKLIKSSLPSQSFIATKYTFVDSSTAILKFTAPTNSSFLGIYDLTIQIASGYVGHHYLKNCFRLVNAPIFANGEIYLDFDSNQVKNAGEPGVQNQKVLLTPDSTYAFSDANGSYSIGTTPGVRKIEWVPGNSGLTLMTNNVSAYTQNLLATSNGFSFGLRGPNPTYSFELIGLYGIARCNSTLVWSIGFKNTGNIPFNGWVYLIKSSNISFVSSQPTATSVSGDTIAWYLTNLQPYTINYIHPTLTFPAAGQLFSFTSIVNSVDQNGNVQNADTLNRFGTISCSFDPNDKSVIPAGIDSLHYTLMSETLNYTIRFQNTGNDTAFVVVVRDTLDEDLDLNTFETIASSHLVKTELSLLTRVAKFTFKNINLPDSNINEAKSHGFINYRIKPKSGLPTNTLVTNKADIYFDFNPPVITNETYNTLVYIIPTEVAQCKLASINIKVVPNPFSNNAQIKYDNKLHQLHTLNIYSIDGQLVEKLQSTDEKLEIHSAKMNSGLYLFELVNQVTSEISRGKFVVEK